ncbi:MAG: hypothetical protein M3378_01040 [Actinomycetota bacterium]|nr:hypothetical protein [Actinomycetota bacterium]
MDGHWAEGGPDRDATAGTFPGGATLGTAGTGWVLAEDQPERALGGALAWGRRHRIPEIHLVAEKAAGLLARRALAFRDPPHVWQLEGRTLARARPEPPAPEPTLSADVAAFLPFFSEAGVEPVVEHGVLTGEVLGLEVARVVVDEVGAFLEVGVGKHDRYAQRLMHHDRPPLEALAAAAASVREVRNAHAPAHEINRLSRERWLRAVVMARPELVGASSLSPVRSPVPRSGLRQPVPAPAAGLDADGRPLVVVCSTGIDVDLVPTAADVRLADRRQARLVLAVPTSDDHPLTRDLAGALAEPAQVTTVPGDWRRLL